MPKTQPSLYYICPQTNQNSSNHTKQVRSQQRSITGIATMLPRVKSFLLCCCYRWSVPNMTVTFLHFSQSSYRPQTWLYLWKANESLIPMIYSPYRNVVNFSRTSRIHFCLKNTPLKPMETKNLFPLGAHGPPSNTPMPQTTQLTTSNDSSIVSCTFAQLHNKVPLVTNQWDVPNSPSKLPLPLRW